MDIKKFGCRKSFKKPTILWFLEWERANKTETMKSRRNEWWQSVGIIPGKVEGKNLKWGGCTICSPYTAIVFVYPLPYRRLQTIEQLRHGLI